jgi:hypothetical protein
MLSRAELRGQVFCLPSVKSRVTLEDVAYIIVAVIIFALGYSAGLKRGGHHYMQRLSDAEHQIRLSRSGLGKR